MLFSIIMSGFEVGTRKYGIREVAVGRLHQVNFRGFGDYARAIQRVRRVRRYALLSQACGLLAFNDQVVSVGYMINHAAAQEYRVKSGSQGACKANISTRASIMMIARRLT